jgi:dipeptidyl aminopeptidase/acylaminoacyl peptidase
MNVPTCGAAVLLFALCTAISPAQQPFTLQQALSAPYATQLTAAPTGHRFAWVEDAEGRHNLWVSDGKPGDARQLTHSTDDDAQDILSVAWSPDGDTLAYTRGAELGADEKPANPAHLQHPTPVQLIVQPLAPDAPEIIVGEGHSPLWIAGGKGLFFIRQGQIWLARFADLSPGSCVIGSGCYLSQGLIGSPTAPTTLQAVFDRGEASHLTLSPDGRLLAFISTRGRGAREHSYLALFDINARKLTFPAASADNDSAPVFTPDGHDLVWLRSPFIHPRAYIPERTSATPWSIQLLDLTTGAHRTVFTPEANKPGSVLPHMATGAPQLFWTSEDQLIFTSEADSWVHLYALDPTHPDMAPHLLTPGDFEVEDVIVGVPSAAERARFPKLKSILFASNEPSCSNDAPAGHPGRLEVSSGVCDPSDLDHRHVHSVKLLGAKAAMGTLRGGSGIETRPTPSADGTLLAALVSDAQHPMHPALINPDGTLTPLNADTPATFPAAALVAPQQVLFPSTDNLTIHGQLFLPPGVASMHRDPSRKHPALLFFHGGPRRQMLLGFPAMDYYSNAYAMNQYLASRGFIVLSVNYRGGVGYGLNFREAENYGPHGASEYNDALAAAKYLRSRADVDPARIGVWGGSYGGYFTALALARNSDLFAAGVDFHGVHEWVREDNAIDWLRSGGAFQSLAEQERIAALAHASSPMADVDKWRSPVLLIHGDNDQDVAYTQTPTLADALRARNVHVEELIFPDELHGFVLHRDWLRSYQAAADFFERTLHPER